MLWTEFTALLLLATAMSFTPGPNTALATAMAANAGFCHSLRFVLAVPSGLVFAPVAVQRWGRGMVAQVPALRWGIQLGAAAICCGWRGGWRALGNWPRRGRMGCRWVLLKAFCCSL